LLLGRFFYILLNGDILGRDRRCFHRLSDFSNLTHRGVLYRLSNLNWSSFVTLMLKNISEGRFETCLWSKVSALGRILSRRICSSDSLLHELRFVPTNALFKHFNGLHVYQKCFLGLLMPEF
jgi:hypothetical protein